MPPQFTLQVAGRATPEANHAVATGGGDSLTVARKRDAIHVPITGRRPPLRRQDNAPHPRFRIPKADGAIGRRRGNCSSVGGKAASIHRSRMAAETADRLSLHEIPDGRHTVLRRRHGPAAIAPYGHRPDCGSLTAGQLPAEHVRFLIAARIIGRPHPDNAPIVSSHQTITGR